MEKTIYKAKATDWKGFVKVTVTKSECEKDFFVNPDRYNEIKSCFQDQELLKNLYEQTDGNYRIDIGKSLMTGKNVVIAIGEYCGN